MILCVDGNYANRRSTIFSVLLEFKFKTEFGYKSSIKNSNTDKKTNENPTVMHKIVFSARTSGQRNRFQFYQTTHGDRFTLRFVDSTHILFRSRYVCLKVRFCLWCNSFRHFVPIVPDIVDKAIPDTNTPGFTRHVLLSFTVLSMIDILPCTDTVYGPSRD